MLVGLVGLCGVELHYTPSSAWLTLGVLLATGLTLALLNLYFQVISAVHDMLDYLILVLLEMADHLWLVPLWRRHLDGHHRLLPRGQPRAWLGLGEGQGEADLDKVLFKIPEYLSHLPCCVSGLVGCIVEPCTLFSLNATPINLFYAKNSG